FLLEPPECCIGCSMGLSFRFSQAAFERITPSDQLPSPALWRNMVHEYPYLRHLCFSWHLDPNRSESPAGGWPPLARGSREPPAKRALSIGRLDRWGSSGCTAGDGLSAGNSVLPAAAKRVRGPKVP